MAKIVTLIKKIYYRISYGYKSSSASYVKYLRKAGVMIGSNTYFYAPDQIHIDLQYPFLIKIGSNVAFAPGTRIITHDFSWHTLRCNFHHILGSSGTVNIGDNTFVGSNCLILKGANIGNNCIIGGGSLVTGTIPDGMVAVGCPAKGIMTIDEFYKKREGRQVEEAFNIFKCYYMKYSQVPKEQVFREYIWLFKKSFKELSQNEKRLFGNDKIAINNFIGHTPPFTSYSEFADYCLRRLNDGK